MKNMKLPDNDEWKKIVDDAFSSDEFHVFSENYNMKKHSMQSVRKGITMKKNNLIMNLTVAAAALTVVAVPTVIYLGSNTTQQYAQVSDEEETSKLASQVEEKENDTIYNIEFGWLPEDFEYNNEESYTYFTNAGNEKIFMIASFIKNLSGEKTENGKALTVRDEYDTDDKTIDIRYSDNYVENSTNKDCTNYGRVATIYFKDTPYELELLVTDDITKDDFRKIIENVRLVPSDTEIADIYTGEQVTDTEVTITDGEDDGQVNEETHTFTEENIDFDTIYNVEYGWLPEGLEYNEDGPYAYKFKNVNNDRSGMTPSFTKFPDGVKVPHIVNCCKDTEEYKGDGKTVTISYRDNYEEDADNYNFGRVAYISFDNTPYTLSLWVTDDITKADLRKIIDNVKLVPSDTETASIYTPYEEENYIENEAGLSDTQKVYHIGEDINISNDGYNHNITIKVNDVSFDTVFGDKNPQGSLGMTSDLYALLDYADCIDENGNLTDNVRKYIQYSNGSDVEYQETEETIPTQIMTVSMTYTNTGDTTIENIFNADNGFYLYTKRDDRLYGMHTVNMLDHFNTDDSESFNYKDTFDVLKADDFSEFIYYTQEKNVLAPNESAEVKIAFAVEDEFMDNVYLDLCFHALPVAPVNESCHLVNVSISEKPE